MGRAMMPMGIDQIPKEMGWAASWAKDVQAALAGPASDPRASGNDVHTVLVGGKVLLRDRQPVHVDQDAVLDAAQREADKMIDRLGLRYALETPRMFWGHSRDLDLIE